MMKTAKVLKACALMLPLMAAGATRGALPEQPAAMTPDDVGMYLELDDLGALRADLAGDPLVGFLRGQLPSVRQPQAWLGVQRAMDMSGGEIIDRYLGEALAIISRDKRGGASSMMLSRVGGDDAAVAIERLKLREAGDVAGFQTYRSTDGRTNFAFRDGWMAMASGGAGADFGKTVLERVDPQHSLATDEKFRTWTRLAGGEQRHALLYTQDPAKGEVHALTLRREGKDMIVGFAGESADIDRVVAKVSDARALDFGPTPASAIAAVTFNIYDQKPQRRGTDLFDRIITPHTFSEHVVPNLAAPVVIFAAPMRADDAAKPELPAFGLAIRLRHTEVAADLDKILDGLVFLANLKTMEWKSDPIAVGPAEHKAVKFRTAGLGAPIAQRIGRPALGAALRVAYGRIGDWYVITSHDRLFTACIDAANDPASALTPETLAAAGLERVDKPVLAAFARPQESAALIRAAAALIVTESGADDGQGTEILQRAQKLKRGAEFLAGLLEHYRGLSLQFRRGEGRAVVGGGKLLRR